MLSRCTAWHRRRKLLLLGMLLRGLMHYRLLHHHRLLLWVRSDRSCRRWYTTADDVGCTDTDDVGLLLVRRWGSYSSVDIKAIERIGRRGYWGRHGVLFRGTHDERVRVVLVGSGSRVQCGLSEGGGSVLFSSYASCRFIVVLRNSLSQVLDEEEEANSAQYFVTNVHF